MKLQNKIAIITGGGRGIGEGIAEALGLEGAKVIVNDLIKEEAEKVSQKLRERGIQAFSFQADVTDEAQVKNMVKKGLEEFGQIDILVNNAGLLVLHEGKKAPIWEMEESEWNQVIAVNLGGTFLCSKMILKEMVKAPKSGRRIINMSSGVARMGGVYSSCAYVASKAGILGLTKTMAREAAPYGITVNTVLPGMIDAPMMRLSTPPEKDEELFERIPLGRLGTPQDVADTIVFLASNAASYITGAAIDVNGGWVMY